VAGGGGARGRKMTVVIMLKEIIDDEI